MNIRRYACAVVAALLATLSLPAQQISDDLLEALDAFRASVRLQEEVVLLPVLAAHKATFDAGLDEDGRSQLNALRAEAAMLQLHMHSLLLDLRQARRSGDNDAVAALEDTLSSLFDRRRKAIVAAIPFVIDNKERLDTLLAAIAPHSREWEAQRRGQWERWLDYHKQSIRSYEDAELIRRLDTLYQPEPATDTPMRTRIAATRFILWDGGPLPDDTDHADVALSPSAGETTPAAAALVRSLYPNPADDRTMLTFTLPAETPVVLTVHTARGDTMLTPLNSRLAAGEHTVEIPTGRLPAGRYYYTLRTGTTHLTGALSVVH